MDNKIKFLSILLVGLAIVLIALVLLQMLEPEPEPIKPVEDNVYKFSSEEELKDYVKTNVGIDYGYRGFVETFVGTTTKQAVTGVEGDSAQDFSTTNIQVEGVDEADIVKNDGKYIYVVSGQKIVILDAYPAEDMKILSEIELKSQVSEIFINDDKLIIFSSGYGPVYESKCMDGVKCGSSGYGVSSVLVYDISDKEEPELETEIDVDGNYKDSRMIGKYVYVISQKHVRQDNPEPPVYTIDGEDTMVKASEVYYFPYPDPGYIFTSIMAIDVEDNDFEQKTFLTGSSQTIYVSQDNIFLTGQRYIGFDDYLEAYIEEVVEGLLPNSEMDKVEEVLDSDDNEWEKTREIQRIVQEYSEFLDSEEKEEFDKELLERMEDFEIKISKQTEKTIIHKINIKKDKINYESSGEVPGRALNQFSMDEYNGYFRIATTTGQVSRLGSSSLNHLYVLDDELDVVGKVEDLAKGEKIYSTRFMGKRAYIVTFKKVDPLFVIDVSNPRNPEVLGYLKITGYSDYLHPYDENHIIGIGKETKGGDEDFSWYQGIKISLFDVSDVSNPVEKAKIEIGDRGTDSYALYEHKAFLFDKERNLLVIPISLAEIDESKYEGEIPDNAYGTHVWQGAYVLNIDTEEITIRGKITHKEEQDSVNYWRYYNYQNAVQRSLFMDNYLYTISTGKVKANDLETIDEISEVKIADVDVEPPIYYEGKI